ncbi:hypothetical protein A8M77_12900 [Variovorax sp. JS1663]|nr:hypothetical protein A8M77_12900 [Variovorax sp. JS1663]
MIVGIENPRATADIPRRWMNSRTNSLPMPASPTAPGAAGLTIHRGSHAQYTGWMETRLDGLWSSYRRGGMTVEQFGRAFEQIVGEAEIMLASGRWGPSVN